MPEGSNKAAQNQLEDDINEVKNEIKELKDEIAEVKQKIKNFDADLSQKTAFAQNSYLTDKNRLVGLEARLTPQPQVK